MSASPNDCSTTSSLPPGILELSHRRSGQTLTARNEPVHVSTAALKVLSVLRILCEADRPVLAVDVAARIGVSLPTAYRAAETLVHAGLARHDENARGYLPSMGVVELASGVLAGVDVKTVSRLHLESLAARFLETVTLAVPEADSIVFVDKVEGSRHVRFYCDVGRRLPLHVGAAARTVLAYLPDQLFEAYISGPLECFTASTRVEPEGLRRDRHAIRTRGYAESYDEVDDGVSGVASAILNSDDEVLGTVSIANLSSRWSPADMQSRGAVLRQVADEIGANCTGLRPNTAAIDRRQPA